jgi:hypothetical protein
VATSKRGGMSETRKLAAILVADGLRSGDPLGQAGWRVYPTALTGRSLAPRR